MTRLALTGSTSWPDLKAVASYVSALAPDTTIVTGDRVGVEATAYETARSRDLATTIVPFDHETYKAGASYHRSVALLQDVDRLVAFVVRDPQTGHVSAGTQLVIDLAKKQDISVEMIETPVPGDVCDLITRLRLRFRAIQSAQSTKMRLSRIRSADELSAPLMTEVTTLVEWLDTGWTELAEMPDGPRKERCTDQWIAQERAYTVIYDALNEFGEVSA